MRAKARRIGAAVPAMGVSDGRDAFRVKRSDEERNTPVVSRGHRLDF